MHPPVYVHSADMCNLIWCNIIPLSVLSIEVWVVDISSLYVHSAICESYFV